MRASGCFLAVLACLTLASDGFAKALEESAPASPQVIGGGAAAPNAHPWIAAIVRPTTFGGQPVGCAGALIEPLWVLTAAHCLFDPDTGAAERANQLEILLGTNNLLAGGQRIAVAEHYVHQDYRFDDLAQRNDIALLRLVNPASQLPIQPLSPARASLADTDTIATVAGWGTTDNEGVNPSFDSLLDIALPIVSELICNELTDDNAATQLCAGGEPGRDSCPGDSGGPLTVPFTEGRSILAGLVSRGSNAAPNFCGDSGFAGIYTRVSAYAEWIADTIAGSALRSGLIASAVLPSSRSVAAGQPATAFMSIVNAGTVGAQGCQPLGPRGLGDSSFSFAATDALTNAPNALQNAPVDIAAGTARSFVFSVTRTQPLESVRLPIAAFCNNVGLAEHVNGVNDLTFSASAAADPPTADVIALAATAGSTPGVVDLIAGQAAFAVATSNAGAAARVNVAVVATDPALSLALAVCETTGSPQGQCLAPAAPAISVEMLASATHSFSVFVGSSVPLVADFARNRIDVRFEDAAGVQRGGTSVAVQ